LPPLPFLTAFLFAIVLLPVKSYSFQLFGICQRLVVLWVWRSVRHQRPRIDGSRFAGSMPLQSGSSRRMSCRRDRGHRPGVSPISLRVAPTAESLVLGLRARWTGRVSSLTTRSVSSERALLYRHSLVAGHSSNCRNPRPQGVGSRLLSSAGFGPGIGLNAVKSSSSIPSTAAHWRMNARESDPRWTRLAIAAAVVFTPILSSRRANRLPAGAKHRPKKTPCFVFPVAHAITVSSNLVNASRRRHPGAVPPLDRE